MVAIFYESYRGGTNNVCVALDSETGNFCTSEKGERSAVRLLSRKMRRLRVQGLVKREDRK